jgi:hypothetical protein
VTNESCQLRVTLKHPSNCQLGAIQGQQTHRLGVTPLVTFVKKSRPLNSTKSRKMVA